MDTHMICVSGDSIVPNIMADIGLEFANSPMHKIGFEIDERGIELLAEKYRDRIFRARHSATNRKLTWETLLMRFDRAWVAAFGDGRNHGQILAHTDEGARALYEEILTSIHGPEIQRKQPAFYMLRYDCSEFSADPVENLPEAVDDDFLRLCYGEDITDWLPDFGDRTVERAGGLTIFEGPPGTGKTSLITQMVRRLEKTHVFYALPAAQDGALSSPELVPFWQKQNVRHADKVKVIVMEDAERLLWRREGENRESVSSLLNIADGMIGRMLRLHLICSVNARMEDLDPAILRPGRLMNFRRFGPLDLETAQQVADSRGVELPFREGVSKYTLAEILNPTDGWEPPVQKKAIGFKVPTLA